LLAMSLIVRAFPLVAFPRLLPAVLLVLAPFASEEQIVQSPPWRRISLAAAVSAMCGICIALVSGISLSWSLITGAAAALAIGCGILLHERTWRTPLASLMLRAGLVLVLIRLWWSPYSRTDTVGFVGSIPIRLST